MAMQTKSHLGSVGRLAVLIAVATYPLLMFNACGAAHGPVLDLGEKPPAIGGTISGMVRAAGSNAPLSARRVTAVELASGAKYEISTAANGGYTLKVPVGRYRLDVVLLAGESIVTRPAELTLSRSDLDAQRDFVIGMPTLR